MNEASLQRIFNDLRNASTEIPIEEIPSWLSHGPALAPKKSILQKIATPKILTMTTTLTLIVTGALILLNPNKKLYPEKITNAGEVKKENVQISNTAPPAKVDQIDKGPAPSIEQTPKNQLNTDNPTPIVTTPEPVKMPAPDERSTGVTVSAPIIENGKHKDPVVSLGSEDTTGAWTTTTDKLQVDTLFTGIQELVLSGKYHSGINIQGSERNNISFNYQYDYQVKGLYARKNPGSKVTYTKKGSTLTITVDINTVVVAGISYGKILSQISLLVPSNIKVRINSSYGDITAKGLLGETVSLQTKYGDIEATSLSGNIRLQSGYGDITLKDMTGKIEVVTKYGDIKGGKITVKESLLLSSGYGDIDCRISNKEDSCRLNLTTGFGRLGVKGNGVNIESTKKIQYGKGGTAITASTSYGNVELWLME